MVVNPDSPRKWAGRGGGGAGRGRAGRRRGGSGGGRLPSPGDPGRGPRPGDPRGGGGGGAAPGRGRGPNPGDPRARALPEPRNVARSGAPREKRTKVRLTRSFLPPSERRCDRATFLRVAARPSAPRPRDLRPRRDPPTLRDLRPRRERAGPATYPPSATHPPAATAPPRDRPRP